MDSMKIFKINPFKNRKLTSEQKQKVNSQIKKDLEAMQTVYSYSGINPMITSRDWLIRFKLFDEDMLDKFYKSADTLSIDDKVYTREEIDKMSEFLNYDAWLLYSWYVQIISKKQ